MDDSTESSPHQSNSQSRVDPPKPSSLRDLNAGYTLIASVILGLGIGYAIDRWAGTQPWWTIGGAGLFIIAGLYQVVKDASR